MCSASISQESVAKHNLWVDKALEPHTYYTTLGGIAYTITSNFYWRETLVEVPGYATQYPALTPEVPQQVFQYITNYDTWAGKRSLGEGDCAPAWKDPRDDIMAHINELSR